MLFSWLSFTRTVTYVVSIADIVFSVLFGLNDVAAQVGGAALFSNLAHVAIFVFIWPARRKCFPSKKITELFHKSCLAIVIVSFWKVLEWLGSTAQNTFKLDNITLPLRIREQTYK